jgi:hypothetical protein
MENHDSRIAHSLGVSTDERTSPLNHQSEPSGADAFAAPLEAPEDNAAPPPPADKRFASEAEERAYWAGVRIGMENAAAARAAQAAAAERPDAAPARHAVAKAARPAERGEPCPEPPPLLSDTIAGVLSSRIADTLDESFPPGGRKPRHDGFTPEKMGEFLRHLAATGVVEHAAAAVQVSASAAYALRNRRQGRAFARMWDAILINRSRDRLASELSSRAISGCVSLRKKDGEVVSEYHYYDNRLAMSILSRLDRLAKREAHSEAHLRALSEDMEEFIGCLAIGADADAFVERRRPVPPPPPPPPEPAAAPAETPGAPRSADADPLTDEEDPFPDVARYARSVGAADYLDVPPHLIPVDDLDPDAQNAWLPDQNIRFYRSGFAIWLHLGAEEGDDLPEGRGAALLFDASRAGASAADRVFGDPANADPDHRWETADIESTPFEDWTEEQLARAWRSGLLFSLPPEYWEALAEAQDEARPGPEDEGEGEEEDEE